MAALDGFRAQLLLDLLCPKEEKEEKEEEEAEADDLEDGVSVTGCCLRSSGSVSTVDTCSYVSPVHAFRGHSFHGHLVPGSLFGVVA